jgi:hypothetical protein
MPIPAAAAVPAKNAGGNGQNNGMVPMTPVVPIDKKMKEIAGREAKPPLKIRPMALAVTFST